jgi:hypothetical protein
MMTSPPPFDLERELAVLRRDLEERDGWPAPLDEDVGAVELLVPRTVPRDGFDARLTLVVLGAIGLGVAWCALVAAGVARALGRI